MPYSMSHVQDPFHCICIIEFGTIVRFSFHEIDDNLAPLSDVKDIGPHR